MSGTTDAIEGHDGAKARTSVPRVLEVGAAWGWRFLVVVAAVLTIGWLLVQLRVVLIPVFVALILAALLQPVVAAQAAYPFIAALARARGMDPDSPPHLRKITRTL